MSEPVIELGGKPGPLRGVRIIELVGIGPAPHAAMLLSDLGADVIRIDRPGGQALLTGANDLLGRGRPSVVLDLKHPAAVEAVLSLVERSDALLEGMRPGVAERLAVGPEPCLARNPALVYARMTGWGQTGPLADVAGHDLTYLAIAGQLHGLGQDQDRPHFPANLLGDFGGGSTYLAVGVLAGIVQAKISGVGQVVDAAIVDGVNHLAALSWGLREAGLAGQERGQSVVDGGAPFYGIYATSDRRHVAVGALEPPFFAALVAGLGLADRCPPQHDSGRWPEMKALFADAFLAQPMAYWAELFEGTDACVAPVLTPNEAARHPHLQARGTIVERDGVRQPAPAPRFSRTTAQLGSAPADVPGSHTVAALSAWGIDPGPLVATGAAIQA